METPAKVRVAAVESLEEPEEKLGTLEQVPVKEKLCSSSADNLGKLHEGACPTLGQLLGNEPHEGEASNSRLPLRA